jgi:hypothetical protein
LRGVVVLVQRARETDGFLHWAGGQ